MKKTFTLFFLILLALVVQSQVIEAQVMTSPSYSIEQDSLNMGGGLSSSSNYVQESTLGETGTGDSGSANYVLHAGYQQMTPIYLSISVSPVNLSPTIPAVGGGSATGQTTVTVTTDDRAGYELFMKAGSSPALVSGVNSFADYVPAGAAPDFTFTVGASASAFGFSPEGSDIAQAFKDNGAVCNAGSSDTANKCWAGLSTSDTLIASRATGNHPNGSSIVLKFEAASGASNVQPVGSYVATSTITAIAL